jgi:transcriptional regulator with XRE-family HTH domain
VIRSGRVARMLHEARAALGWSQREAAKRAGFSHVFIGDMERQQRPTSAENALALAEAYGLDVDAVTEAWLADAAETAAMEMHRARARLAVTRMVDANRDGRSA